MIIKLFCFIIFSFSLSFLFSTELENTPKKKLRFFCLDFHGSVSADVKSILEELGHEVIIWVVPTEGIGNSRWTLGYENDPVEIINYFSWLNSDKNIYNQFYERYKEFLSQFDGYIAAYNASFALLYEKLDKPIIIINAVRYEIPFTDKPELWSWLNDFLIKGVNRNKLFIVANNKGDQNYLKYYTELDSELIPSLCKYTNAYYSGNKTCFICQPSVRNSQFSNYLQRKYSNLISNDLPRPYKWEDLYDYKGIIHFPYQISTMSIFEEYSANVPLFFPSKKFLLKLRKESHEILNEASYFHLFHRISPPTIIGDPNNLSDVNVIKFWIDNADFYDKENMPYIQYFDSFKHLEHLLNTVDLHVVSQKMKRYNRKRKAMVLKKWDSLLQKVISACEK